MALSGAAVTYGQWATIRRRGRRLLGLAELEELKKQPDHMVFFCACAHGEDFGDRDQLDRRIAITQIGASRTERSDAGP
jgi:hypothetical protein